MKIKALNENKTMVLAGNGLLIFSGLLVFQIFITFYQATLNFNNPLIPQELFYEINKEHAICGIMLTAGILIMTMLKSIKQNFLVLLIGILTILLYYGKTNGLI